MKSVSNTINDLSSVLECNLQEINQKIEIQKILIEKIFEENRKVDPDFVKKIIKLCPSRLREFKLREVLKETIFILDDTRKSFKSKKLENLRRELITVLAEI